jgi:hypothetical protein
VRVASWGDVDRALRQIEKRLKVCALTDGHQLDDVELTTTTKTVAHKLGRRAQGYIVVGRDAAEIVYDENAGKADLATNLHLSASGAVTVSLWVY